MTAAAPVHGTWKDVLAEGRLAQFVLICLAVWLHAADSLVTATIMPSVGADLGGYAYFGWATAGFLLGSVVAGASAGWLTGRTGLRRAFAFSAAICLSMMLSVSSSSERARGASTPAARACAAAASGSPRRR